MAEKERERIKHFLLIYDHAAGRQVGVEEFGSDSKRAVARYEELEEQNRSNDNRMDIVLVGSDSLDTVRVTHSNYFTQSAGSVDDVEDFLRAIFERHRI